MVIIGIDPSLNSTAITIYKNSEYKIFNYTNNKPTYKWIKAVDNIVNFSFHKFINFEKYSESEIEKLKAYMFIAVKIVDDIKKYADDDTHIFIEGYSYSSAQGRLIDLVTFSTLLRERLLWIDKVKINIIPPSSLKKFISDVVYEKDKKGISRNENGKAGGSFDKKDMMEALLKLDIDNEYINYLQENKDILLEKKNLSKPFDDVNDSFILAYYGLLNN